MPVSKTGSTKDMTKPGPGQPRRLSERELEKMAVAATVDAYDESEQAVGWLTALEEGLALPFETNVLGIDVMVEKLELTEDNEIVAVCRRGRERRAISLASLPLPEPPPQGWEWIEGYRYWVCR